MKTPDDEDVEELSFAEIVQRAHKEAEEAGYPSLVEAYAALDRDELRGTMLHVELTVLRDLARACSIVNGMTEEQKAFVFGSDEGECHGKP